MARILALDPGTVRCGVAISDSNETLAFPREALATNEHLERAIAQLVDEEFVEMIVVGRPVSLAGNDTASTTLAEEIFARVEAAVTVPVVQWDERLTTSQAQRSMREAGVSSKAGRSRIDSAAAVVLLQHYIEVRNAS